MPARESKQQIIVRERARSLALFSSIGDGVIATNEEGMISEVNEAACRILGFEAKELLGQWFPRAIHAVDEKGNEISMLKRPAAQAMVSGKPVVGKTFYVTKAKRLAPVAVTVSPILIDSRPVGAIEVFRDITREHQIDRMKSEFISIASHQLRTPLTAIKTYAHLLANGFSGQPNKQQQKFLDIILASSDRMNELINTLLDIAKIEEGSLTVSPRKVDVHKLIQEVMQELAPLAKDKHINLEAVFNTKNYSLKTDPLLLREICSNLLSNAIKYTPNKGQVSLILNEDAKKFRFVITDTGFGIPKHQHSRVFSKFFRAENTLKREVTGSGLGLYLVKQLVTRLKGQITFESSEGKGTTFIFSLPKA